MVRRANNACVTLFMECAETSCLIPGDVDDARYAHFGRSWTCGKLGRAGRRQIGATERRPHAFWRDVRIASRMTQIRWGDALSGRLEGEDNMRLWTLVRGPAAACLALFPVSVGHAENPVGFYKGKNVDLYIGYSAGGGYDLYARSLARHMGGLIAGNPAIVPKNMPGAGSLVLANWLYNVAPKDGTAFGTIGRGTAFDPLLGSTKAQFDASKFNWIGSMNDED